MKRYLVTTALALSLSAVPVLARASTPTLMQHAPNPHKAAMRIAKELGLTSDQTARLEPILAERQQKMQALRSNTSLSDTDRQQQMKTIRQGTRAELKGVLTPDQIKQFKAMRHSHAEQTAKPTGV